MAVHFLESKVVDQSTRKTRWHHRVFALLALAAASSVAVAGCSVATSENAGEAVDESAEAISGADAVSRAMEWADAKLKYCQAPNHGHDNDAACSSTCTRQNNPAWDPYRSDCSGLISWAWGLPAPGHTTLMFAPYDNSITHTIKAIDLQPGDAVNNTGHVMLFKHWIDKGKRAVFIEEPGCSSATPYAHELSSDVSINGDNIFVSYDGESFHAIRYNKMKAELTLKAKATKKWSNARRYHGKHADYIACAGAPVKMSFTFKNEGSAVWRDVKGRGKNIGNDIFLVTTSGKEDKLTGHKRFSLRDNANDVVRGDHKAKNCSTENGCRRTTFIQGAMKGTAPKKPGIYHSRWRLRDYSKSWGKQSHGFGPKVDLSLKVVSCDGPKQDCGCRVWCTDGTSHNIAAGAADSNASCKSIGTTVCLPAKYLDHTFQACAAPDPIPTQTPNPEPAPTAGNGGEGGTSAGTGGTDPSAGTGGDPNAGTAGSAGSSAEPTWSSDDGNDSDPNGYDIDPGLEDPDTVEDDPGFSDSDGFNGDADSSKDTAVSGGCSIAPGDRRSGLPWGAGASAIAIALIEARRRQRRRRTV